MMRLVRRGLMFGNLYDVSSPTLVTRYNRALQHLIGRATTLNEFHIDISGYSPEIAEELDDQHYLNPHGCNRQFILLSVGQKTAPLLNAKFSTSRRILRQFINQNEDQLFSLTARDAVAGELVNSIYGIEVPSDLFSARTIEIEADTVGSHIAASDELSGKIDQFMSERDAWWDDVLTAEMIELAKQTGDITRNPIKLGENTFSHDNFYTAHFGGLYIFRGAEHATCISFGEKKTLDDLPVETVLSADDRKEIAEFLNENDLVEPIVSARNVDAAAILKQKLDFIVIDVAAEHGEDLENTNRNDLRRLGRKFRKHMPEEFHGLHAQWRQLRSGSSRRKKISPDHPAYFYGLRSRHHKDKDLVNTLLAQLSPLDFRQLFICHKDAFYDAYRGWSEVKKDYVAKFLEAEYAVDKAGARLDLFGPEPEMVQDDYDGSDDVDDDSDDDNDRRSYSAILERKMGPWGPIPYDD
ncbi:MAG: DUF6638 family protein [Stappiaceae bacterium]